MELCHRSCLKFLLLSFHFTVLHSRRLDQTDKRVIMLCFYAGMTPSSEKLLLQSSCISKNAEIHQIKKVPQEKF